MRPISRIFAGCALIAALAIPSIAADDFGTVLGNIGKDAAKDYMAPGVTWFGAGMNAGWYNSSKSLSMFKLPVGISVLSINEPFVVIDEDMRNFDFNGKIPAKMIMDPMVKSMGGPDTTWEQLLNQPLLGLSAQQKENLKNIPFSAPNQPTIFGTDSQKTTTVREFLRGLDDGIENILFAPGVGPLNSVAGDTVKLPFKGIDFKGTAPSIPSLTVLNLGIKKIPIIDNIQLGLRMIPEQKIGDFGKVSQLGIKVQHEITRYIPFMSKIPFIHSSAYWAMNNLDIKIGPATIAQHNWVAMVNASADAKFLLGLGVFAGLGMENSNMNLKVDMSKQDLPSFEIDIPGKNGFRAQVGARLSLLIFDIYADANYGAITTYNVGITVLGLNGL